MRTGMRPKTSKGAVMVELVVAAILVAVAVTAMTSVVLQGSGHRGKMQRRERGMLHAGQLLNDLKNYVTADPSAATQGSAPNQCWNLRPGGMTSPCPGGWALSPGQHDASFMLPAELRNAPINATLTYNVTVGGTGNRAVTVDFNWSEPP